MQGDATASLRQGFGELASRPLFIVYALRPKTDGSGRTDKVPVDPLTLEPIDCHNEANRVTLAEAELWVASLVPQAPVLAYGIGYVLVESANTFFLDLDHVRTDAGWADFVSPLVNQFPGAFSETSSSGDGIHVLGSYVGPRPLHRTKAAAIHAEFYTAGRFCALTGSFGRGVVLTDHTGAVAALIATHFPPRDTEEEGAAWSVGPVPQWSGPTNDEVLIAKAVKSGSAASIFGGKASFADLWTQNTAKLSDAYPSTTGQPYDASRADQALTNHLAFWTGNDCERMARLLRTSGLARGKHDRESYLRDTILNACASQHEWYTERVAQSPATVLLDAGVPPTPTPGAVAGSTLPIAAPAPPFDPYGTPKLPREDFMSVLSAGTYIYLQTREYWPKKSVDSACGQGMSDVIDVMAPVHQLIWAPGHPEYSKGRLLVDGGWVDVPDVAVLNVYRPPLAFNGNAADVQPWVDHIMRVYPESGGHLIRWFAHRAQYPGVKCNHAIVLGGGSGIGKDTILEPVKAAVGPWNFAEIAPKVIFGRFNGYVQSTILRVSEVKGDDINPFDFYEATKTLIAAPPDVHRVDEKHVAEHAVLNVTGVILTTNHLTGGLYLPPEDRRHYFAWSRVTPDEMKAPCAALWAWYAAGGLANVVTYLRTCDLSDFDPKATPPRTEAWQTVVANAANPDDDDIHTALDVIGRPAIVTVEQVLKAMPEGTGARSFLLDPRNRRTVPHRFGECGYTRCVNPTRKDGRWKLVGNVTPVTVFQRADVTADEAKNAILATSP